jgi:ubiquinone/menaquinone biosynthesis C-methylase UbiE
VLDLGAGEGYVGAEVARRWPVDVHLADVIDMNRTELLHTVYDGRRLPFKKEAFDTTILYFVLHHAEEPEAVIREALRVTRKEVVVVESVYKAAWDLNLLTFLDVWANRIRSLGRMRTQEEHLHFRTANAWIALFEKNGARVVRQFRKGRWVHKQHFFLLEPDIPNVRPQPRNRCAAKFGT